VRRAANPDAYAQKILGRAWLSERRRPWRRERTSDRLPEQAAPPADAASALPERDAVRALLRSLGPRQRAVLILRFYFDHTVEQTADILDVTVGTVKSQTARALQALRAVLPPPATVSAPESGAAYVSAPGSGAAYLPAPAAGATKGRS
jgi:RNA polymerase sigma factor (sigma-70 family)